MTEERLPCVDCGAMVLPSTAQANAGLCMPCAKMGPAARSARRAFALALADGSAYVPSEVERSSASPLHALMPTHLTWQLEPDFHGQASLASVLEQAATLAQGHVFLLADSGARVNLGFTADWAVCEFQDEAAAQWRYARSEHQAVQQLPAEQQVTQACPCCGVSVGWFPSRTHLPRQQGFALLAAVVQHQAEDVLWLNLPDTSHVEAGRG